MRYYIPLASTSKVRAGESPDHPTKKKRKEYNNSTYNLLIWPALLRIAKTKEGNDRCGAKGFSVPDNNTYVRIGNSEKQSKPKVPITDKFV
ncbi:hypothetical protein TNCV_841901 [Trichonephila clavipes]|nr:hypothetical protein TNCV_841901 [Trichonephila clavipes]